MLRSKRFIVMLGLGMALAIPAVAQASPAGYVVHPTDGSYGYVRADLQTLYACDIRVDGHRVRLHYTNQAIQNPDELPGHGVGAEPGLRGTAEVLVPHPRRQGVRRAGGLQRLEELRWTPLPTAA